MEKLSSIIWVMVCIFALIQIVAIASAIIQFKRGKKLSALEDIGVSIILAVAIITLEAAIGMLSVVSGTFGKVTLPSITAEVITLIFLFIGRYSIRKDLEDT